MPCGGRLSCAASDETARRRSTFANTHSRFKLFTGRPDPSGRDEQYERLYVVLVDATPFAASTRVYEVGKPDEILPLTRVFDELVQIVADRNPDFYECIDGKLVRVTS